MAILAVADVRAVPPVYIPSYPPIKTFLFESKNGLSSVCPFSKRFVLT